MTMHSALSLSCGGRSDNLSADKMGSIRSRLGKLCLIIIDECSKVGSNMFLNIHKKLNEIMENKSDHCFGAVSILAVGDLYQLKPVMDKHIFSEP